MNYLLDSKCRSTSSGVMWPVLTCCLERRESSAIKLDTASFFKLGFFSNLFWGFLLGLEGMPCALLLVALVHVEPASGFFLFLIEENIFIQCIFPQISTTGITFYYSCVESSHHCQMNLWHHHQRIQMVEIRFHAEKASPGERCDPSISLRVSFPCFWFLMRSIHFPIGAMNDKYKMSNVHNDRFTYIDEEFQFSLKIPVLLLVYSVTIDIFQGHNPTGKISWERNTMF